MSDILHNANIVYAPDYTKVQHGVYTRLYTSQTIYVPDSTQIQNGLYKSLYTSQNDLCTRLYIFPEWFM